MQNYKEEEEETERLVNRLVEGVTDDVMMDNDQGEDILHQLMDVDMGQQATHSPLLVNMCHYSDVSSADTSPNAGQNTNEDIRVQNNPCNSIVMLMIHMLIAVKE